MYTSVGSMLFLYDVGVFCYAGQSWCHCHPCFKIWPCTGWLFEGWKHTRETCCREMCPACLSIGKRYYLCIFYPVASLHSASSINLFNPVLGRLCLLSLLCYFWYLSVFTCAFANSVVMLRKMLLVLANPL